MSVENLKKKQSVIDEIKEKLERAESAVVIDYMGISVEQADAMRKRLRDANVDYTVYKNKMVSRAIKDTKFAELEKVLSGPSAFAISYDDAIAPAKILSGIMKDFKKMEFKAGIIEGTMYDADGVKAIAMLPTRDELISKFMGSILSPVSKFARTLQAIAEQKAEQ
jgi:large subunit ribosomal protein L10